MFSKNLSLFSTSNVSTMYKYQVSIVLCTRYIIFIIMFKKYERYEF